MATVELVYEASCPNVRETRARLIEGFHTAGVQPSWAEWEVNEPETPDRVKRLGSPTVLVNGKDVAGTSASDAENCCRIYAVNGPNKGVPPLDMIVAALTEGEKDHPVSPAKGLRRVGLNAAVLPALGTALLPKLTCPACWPAYASLLGNLGVGFVNYTPYLLPLTAAFLVISVGALAWRASRRRGYGPFALGGLAAAVILVGRFGFDSETAMWLGLATLVGTSLWNTWPRNAAGPTDAESACPACVRAGGR